MASKKSFYVYTHSRPDGSVFYVGKGSGRRAWNFTRGRNQHYRSIIEKHGAENIHVEVMPCNDEVEAFDLEKWLIISHEGLSNKTDGGEGAAGREVSEKTRAAFVAFRELKLPATEKKRSTSSRTMKLNWENNREAMMANVNRLTDMRRGVARPAHIGVALSKAHKGKKLEGDRLAAARAGLAKGQEAAKAWHSSEEGLRWHRENGKKSWSKAEWVKVNCAECGRAFNTRDPKREKCCDASCKNQAYRRKLGFPVGLRPDRKRPSLLLGKRAVSE